MALRGKITQQERKSSATRRGAPRLYLSLEFSSSTVHDDVPTLLVHNMSRTGMLLEMDAPLSPGEKMMVEVPLLGAVAAEVVWTSGRFVGCRFTPALSRADWSAALLRHPIEPELSPVDGPSDQISREPFADRLARLREERGLSRSQLAERAGVSKPSVWAWETGRAPPRRSNLRQVARALDLNEDVLLGLREPAQSDAAPDKTSHSQ